MPEFKTITPANWLEPEDEKHQPLIPGTKICMTGEQWVAAVMQHKLSNMVPKAIEPLLLNAQAALIYGYCFAPLYSLALEQLFRVGEAAIVHKCAQARAPFLNTYVDRIDWLVRARHMSRDEGNMWHNKRRIRNELSHQDNQIFIPPDIALSTLGRMVADINRLFKG